MSKLFEPGSPLERAIHEGDTEKVLELLDPMDAAGRAAQRPTVTRCARLMSKARFAYQDKTFAGWGRRVDEDHSRAITTAAVIVGCAKEIVEVYGNIDHVISLGRKYGGAALDGLVDAMLEREWGIRDAQRLVESGLVARPDTEAYYVGVMNLVSGNRLDDRDIHARMAVDPGLREVLLRMLEVEGNSNTSLANIDKYAAKKGTSWAATFLELIDRGVYTRAELIDKCLGVLERGWIQFRSFWFSDFHEKLAPTVVEMQPHASRYLHLLGSRIPPTVSFALDCVKQLDKAGEVEPATLLGALRPVLSSAVKGQVSAALKLADSVVKKNPALAGEAASAVAPALALESAELQKQVLNRLSEWDAQRITTASLGVYATGIAAVNRKAFDALVGTDKKAAPVKPLAATQAQGLRNPLDPEFAVAPIETLDELIERAAYVFENDTDAEEFERVIAGLVRFAPFDEPARARFAAVAKRTTKVRKPVAQQAARMLHFFMTGERLESIWSQNFFGHPNLVTKYLNHRVDDLANFGLRAGANMPLSTPTHRRGFIDPVELARRLAVFQAQKIECSKLDLADALMRLAHGAGGALAAARKLEDDDFARALRLALGDDVKPRDAELAAAARRMRGLLTRRETSARAWKVAAKKFKYGGTREILHVEPASGDFADPVTQLEREAARIECDGWYTIGAVGSSDEGCIGFYATMLPADLEGFCAEGAALLIRNVNWFQAHWEHKAYLRALLPSTVAMGPMATLLLAVGLAGKEAGETAVAVDVLVQSVMEGRLDAKLLARDVAELLRTEQTVCARYAKSLRAALRIDAAVAPAVTDVLCAAVEARPADPPKDTAALLELLLEIIVAHELPMPAATRAALQAMQIGGKGKSLRQQLLARV